MGGSARRAVSRVRRRRRMVSGDRSVRSSGIRRSPVAFPLLCRHRQPRSPCPKRQEDPVDTAADITAMRRAIELAARGLGSTSPNPVVGCVVLDAAGHRVGEGFHQ
ncbi:riboflavin biosynthesis protein RibD, partial [Streptomyces sp. NPDC059605]